MLWVLSSVKKKFGITSVIPNLGVIIYEIKYCKPFILLVLAVPDRRGLVRQLMWTQGLRRSENLEAF